MKYHEITLPYDFMYLLLIGDTHIGDKNCNYKLLKENIEWVENTEEARVFIMGDVLNCATMGSASSPFEQNMTLEEQIDTATKIFEPIKEKIIGVITGNHERRLVQFCGYDPLIAVCRNLGIQYLGKSSVVSFKFHQGDGSGGNWTIYTMYAHHTTGGGKKPGSKMNRIDDLRGLVSNCDIYAGGHNHQLGVIPVKTMEVDVKHKTVREKRQLLIDCGSYLNWDNSYAEDMMLQPAKLGSPRIRLDGRKKDVHCSI